jgi:hypothetical protein
MAETLKRAVEKDGKTVGVICGNAGVTKPVLDLFVKCQHLRISVGWSN